MSIATTYTRSTELQDAMEALRNDDALDFETMAHTIYRDENTYFNSKPFKNKRARRARIACKQTGFGY